MQNYELFLYEDYYKNNEPYIKLVCEIGSSLSEFSGKAINPVFYTKIDGTHELSFSLPKYCIDEITGELVFNELTDLLVNKCKILLRKIDGEEGEENPSIEEFFLVINKRTDSNKDGKFLYEYECGDAYIEELSKTGYGISFNDDIEGNSLGTIKELSDIVLKDSGWTFGGTMPSKLQEYTTELKYNADQKRYDMVYIPRPVHPIKYIPELKRYCNKLDVKINQKSVYCYEDTEQVTSNTVQNILYNADTFLDTTGWTTYRSNSDTGEISSGLTINSEKASEDKYCLKITSTDTIKSSRLLNDTASSSNKQIVANQPYLLKIKYNGTLAEGNGISSVNICSKNPLSDAEADKKPEYNLYYDGDIFKNNTYYVIKTNKTINNPYISFGVRCPGTSFLIESIQLFELKCIDIYKDNTNIIDISAEENYLTLLSELSNKDIIASTDKRLQKICLPETSKISAHTLKKVMYFTRDNWTDSGAHTGSSDDTVTYYDFKKDVFPRSALSSTNIVTINGNSLPVSGQKNVIYKLSADGKYYQYYSLTRDGVTGGAWDLALYGDGTSDKRRTLIAEKSNRFNLIQDLAELFKVWSVFTIKRDENGKLSKKVSFREKAIQENFSGFHKGVNLKDLARTVESDEIVTKMFVEDIESNYSDTGFITIRTSKLNPWGENYYYNFKYYIDQGFLTGKEINADLNKLYSKVKNINNSIFELNDKIANARVELSNMKAKIKSLSYSVAAAIDRENSLQSDYENNSAHMSDPDKATLENNKNKSIATKNKYSKEKETLSKKYEQLRRECEGSGENGEPLGWVKKVAKLQEDKKELIKSFEYKYSPYIKEGVWSDSSYADNDTYYIDSQNVSYTSAMPKISWNISTIDGSVLEELKDFKVKVGDQTFIIDNDFFGREKDGTEHVFEVLISGIKEYLDDGTKNEIEVRNYLTSFEDLFQRISAATQTLELNEQVYNKGANFTAGGQIQQNILQNTLLNNSMVLSNSSDNSYKLDGTGLHLQDALNPSKKLKVTAEGIFISNGTSLNTGETEWKTGITAEGIDASILNAGEINTSLIKIGSKDQLNFTWNQLGITSYKTETDGSINNNSFVRLDSFGLYSIDGTGSNFQVDKNSGVPWFKKYATRGNALTEIISNATFSMTEKGFRLNVKTKEVSEEGSVKLGSVKLGYENEEEGTDPNPYGLFITDNSGDPVVSLRNNGTNQIAGWTLTNTELYNDKKNRLFGMRIPSKEGHSAIAIGTSGDKNGDKWGAAQFRVTGDGTLYATNAVIEGNITATRGTIGGCVIDENNKLRVPANQVDGLTLNDIADDIAGWTISTSKLSTGGTNGTLPAVIQSPSGPSATVFAVGGLHSNYQEANTRKFFVNASGKLYANDVEIEGGTIGGFEVQPKFLRKQKIVGDNTTEPKYRFYISADAETKKGEEDTNHRWIQAVYKNDGDANAHTVFSLSKTGLFVSDLTIIGENTNNPRIKLSVNTEGELCATKGNQTVVLAFKKS